MTFDRSVKQAYHVKQKVAKISRSNTQNKAQPRQNNCKTYSQINDFFSTQTIQIKTSRKKLCSQSSSVLVLVNHNSTKHQHHVIKAMRSIKYQMQQSARINENNQTLQCLSTSNSSASSHTLFNKQQQELMEHQTSWFVTLIAFMGEVFM